MRTGSVELISHKQKLDWLKWLDEKHAFARKGRADFLYIPESHVVSLYEKEILLITELESFISTLPIK